MDSITLGTMYAAYAADDVRANGKGLAINYNTKSYYTVPRRQGASSQMCGCASGGGAMQKAKEIGPANGADAWPLVEQLLFIELLTSTLKPYLCTVSFSSRLIIIL